MLSIGFKKINDHTFENDNYIVSDLHPRNVLKNAAGNIFVVDNRIEVKQAANAETAKEKNDLQMSQKGSTFAAQKNKENENRENYQRIAGELVGGQEKGRGLSAVIADTFDRGNASTPKGSGPDAFADVIEQSAKENGVWVTDIKEITDKFISNGVESEVYRSKDNPDNVLKVYSLSYLSDFAPLLDRLDVHNRILKEEVSYKIAGFTKDSTGEVSVILEQPYIYGFPASQEQITDYLTEKGFTPTGVENQWTNGQYTLSDVRPANVFVDSENNFFLFDVYPTERATEQGAQSKNSNVRFQVSGSNEQVAKDAAASFRDFTASETPLKVQSGYRLARKMKEDDERSAKILRDTGWSWQDDGTMVYTHSGITEENLGAYGAWYVNKGDINGKITEIERERARSKEKERQRHLKE
jgi:hypothetical protein